MEQEIKSLDGVKEATLKVSKSLNDIISLIDVCLNSDNGNFSLYTLIRKEQIKSIRLLSESRKVVLIEKNRKVALKATKKKPQKAAKATQPKQQNG